MRRQKKLAWILILAIVMTMLPVSGAYGAELQPVHFQVQMGTSAGDPKPVGTKLEAGAGETVYATVNLVNEGKESIDLAGILLGLSYNTKDFSFVSAKALLAGTTIERPKEGDVRILNIDTKEGGKIATVPGGRQSIQLVELELKVKNTTPGEAIQLAINESGNHQYQLVGETHHVDTPVGEFGTITVAQPLGVEISGKIALTAGEVSNATVLLTTDTILNAETAYAYDESKAAYVAEVSTSGAYTFPTVTANTYTLLIRKAGALYYQDNVFEVGTEAITDETVITLPVGDLNLDGNIGFTDLNMLINYQNYGKPVTDEGVLALADLNDDGNIGFTDLNILINYQNYGQAAVIVTEK